MQLNEVSKRTSVILQAVVEASQHRLLVPECCRAELCTLLEWAICDTQSLKDFLSVAMSIDCTASLSKLVHDHEIQVGVLQQAGMDAVVDQDLVALALHPDALKLAAELITEAIASPKTSSSWREITASIRIERIRDIEIP